MWIPHTSDEEREEKNITDDSNRPSPHLATHSEQGASETENVSDNFFPVDRLRVFISKMHLCIKEPMYN